MIFKYLLSHTPCLSLELVFVLLPRLLLRVLQQQQSSFVLQRSEKALHTTDEALQHLNPTQATLQALTQVRTGFYFET